MFAITDYVIIVVFLFFIYRGAKKGFLKTFLGPIFLIAASFFAYVYYTKTGDIKLSLLIAIAGPFIANLLFGFLVKIIHKVSKKEPHNSPISQFLGALINVLWSGALLLMTIFLITLIPIKNTTLEKIQLDIETSKTYTLLDALTGKRASQSTKSIQNLSNVVSDPAKLKKLQTSPKFKKLQENQKLQAVLQDEKIVNQIKKKDYNSLMQNPKILKLMQDKEFIKGLLELNKTL